MNYGIVEVPGLLQHSEFLSNLGYEMCNVLGSFDLDNRVNDYNSSMPFRYTVWFPRGNGPGW